MSAAVLAKPSPDPPPVTSADTPVSCMSTSLPFASGPRRPHMDSYQRSNRSFRSASPRAKLENHRLNRISAATVRLICLYLSDRSTRSAGRRANGRTLVTHAVEELSVEQMRVDFVDWLTSEASSLREFREERVEPIEDRWARSARFMGRLFDAGWNRQGWPREVGGVGGPAILRNALYDELERAGYRVPEQYIQLEIQ